MAVDSACSVHDFTHLLLAVTSSPTTTPSDVIVVASAAWFHISRSSGSGSRPRRRAVARRRRARCLSVRRGLPRGPASRSFARPLGQGPGARRPRHAAAGAAAVRRPAGRDDHRAWRVCSSVDALDFPPATSTSAPSSPPSCRHFHQVRPV